ncbi:MAG TPA: SMP-30/gluconolactonase/LRE family protein [Candidatus Angelobacter sp.]|nr:SMP-30/gluconolactonase/LRE family protein [Candidatus Angelobacter sp.]
MGALLPGLAWAADIQRGTPATVITNPPRDFSRAAAPVSAPDPDVLTVDKSFASLLIAQELIHRIHTGLEWAEGPAWSSQGQYAVFSDVKGDTLYRYIWETRQVTPFRRPSYNSNGNAFDFEGRQLSCQDFFRRVVRWEHDGSLKVLADNFNGSPLNSPNDLAPHPDGSVWFTDPSYGDQLSEGHPNQAGEPMNQDGRFDPSVGNGGTGLMGGTKQSVPRNVYRWDPSGRLDLVVPEEPGLIPNGICFSPDYKLIYLVRGAGLWVGDVQGSRISNLRIFTDCMVDGVHCGPDGMRADRAGNIWSGSSGILGYSGVTVWNPAGKLIGRVRLPEICANVCFAGPKRDWLFMCATQSIYMLRVNIQGASPG